MNVTIDSVEGVISETLRKFEVSQSSIDILSKTICFSNRSGISTHGIRHLPMYVKKLQSGCINPKDDVKAVVDYEAITILDAESTFGQVAAQHALDLGIEKAKKYGISMVGVRNSNTFGAAAYFGYEAARQGMAAIIFANSAPAIAPAGGNKAIFGTNPLCYAFPGTEDSQPIVLDMATTVAARSKVRLAAKNNEKIPLDWAVGPDGQPTDDPNVALLGSLLPIAGYKGYGLSMFIDLFAGLLTGSAYAGGVKPLTKADQFSKNGQFFVFIDVSKAMEPDMFRERVDYFHKAVKACGEEGCVRLPGERSGMLRAENETMIQISQKEYDDLNNLALELGIEARIVEVK